MFGVDVFNLPNIIVNDTHILNQGNLVGGNDNSIIFKIDKVGKIL